MTAKGLCVVYAAKRKPLEPHPDGKMMMMTMEKQEE